MSDDKYIQEQIKLHTITTTREDKKCRYRTWWTNSWHGSQCSRAAKKAILAMPLCTQHHDKIVKEAARLKEWREGK